MLANIFKLAWRNIWRNKRRTALTLVSITVAVLSLVFVQSFIAGILDSTGEALVKLQSGHIKIAHKEYLRLERVMPKEQLVTGWKDLKQTLAGFPGVETIDASIRFQVMLSFKDANEAALVSGIEPGAADQRMELSGAVVRGSYLDESAQDLIIGEKLAEKLGVKVDDELLLVTSDINYSTYALAFRVGGIFRTGYSWMDKHMLYIPLSKAREMLDCGDAVHEILVYLDNGSRAPFVAAQMRNLLAEREGGEDLKAIAWQENDLVREALPIAISIWGSILMVVMFIAGLVILNTMLMTVMERYHEIGVIKALGFKNREIFSIVLVEALYIGSIGSIIGGIFGSSISLYLEKYGWDIARGMGQELFDKVDIPIPMVSTVMYPDFSVTILAISMVFGILTAMVAVLYPAYRSAKMSPVEAFHSKLNV